MKKLAAWDLLLALLLWAVVFLAYLMGYGYFMRLQIMDGGLFVAGAILSISAITAVVLYALRKYRGQLIGPRLYVIAVILGLLPVAIFTGLAFVNTQFDNSPPQTSQVKVVQLGEKAAGGKLHLAIEIWRTRPVAYNILVSSDVYTQCYVGRPLWVTTRSGALGFEWLLGVELNRATPPPVPAEALQTEF